MNAEFPCSKFRGSLAHFGDENRDEVKTALNTAFKMCRTHGVSFVEACEATFGNDESQESDLHDRIDELEEKLRKSDDLLQKAQESIGKDETPSSGPNQMLALVVSVVAVLTMIYGLFR